MTDLFLKTLTQHVELGGEEEEKNLFTGLQLYNLFLPLTVSTFPLSAYTGICVCVKERQILFIFSLKAKKKFSFLPFGDKDLLP